MVQSLFIIGGLACLVFTFFVILLSYSGIAAEMRDENGNFKKIRSRKAIFGGLLFVTFLLGLLVFAGIYFRFRINLEATLMEIWFFTFLVFFIVHIYDLLILDYLIIVKWRPKFLKLPNTPYYTTLKPHFIGFFRGLPIGLISSFIAASLVSYFF